MASLWDPITVESIGKKVVRDIEDFDANVRSIGDLLSFGLADDKYSSLYQVAGSISLAIGGVCLAMAVIYAYMAIVKEGLTLRGDWKRIVTILLKLAIAKGLIDCSTQFITWIYSFFAKISQLVIEITTNKSEGSLGAFINPQDITNGLGIDKNTGKLTLHIVNQYANLIGFFFFILGVFLFIIALARILKIYLLLSFGAIAFAKIPLYGFEGCKDYVKEMKALGLQGAIISGAIGLYEIAICNIADIVTIKSVWGSFGSILVVSISLMLLISKSEELARKVV